MGCSKIRARIYRSEKRQGEEEKRTGRCCLGTYEMHDKVIAFKMSNLEFVVLCNRPNRLSRTELA